MPDVCRAEPIGGSSGAATAGVTRLTGRAGGVPFSLIGASRWHWMRSRDLPVPPGYVEFVLAATH